MNLHAGTASLAELAIDGFANLYAHRQRSILALLGIVIGTASVVALLTIGHMAEREALKLFSHMGVNTLVVQINGDGLNATGLDHVGIETVHDRLPAIEQAAPLAVGSMRVPRGDETLSFGVVAATPGLEDLAGLKLEKGRFIRAIDDQSLVAVVGSKAAAALSTPAHPVELGTLVAVDRYLFTVIGVLREGPATAFDPTDFNNAVIVPLASAHRAMSPAQINAAIARVRPGGDVLAATTALSADLKRYSPGVDAHVQSARQLIQTLKAQKAVNTRFLAAIAGISLLVGGIGVMNVMLMGVMERRREIGLRAAIGATPRDIQIMFLVEAAVLALAGGVAGVLLGVAAAYVAAILSHWSFSLALYALPLGAGVATVVGIGFGLYPAVKASKLDPIEALRAE